jgi:hypothetical protein
MNCLKDIYLKRNLHAKLSVIPSKSKDDLLAMDP